MVVFFLEIENVLYRTWVFVYFYLLLELSPTNLHIGGECANVGSLLSLYLFIHKMDMKIFLTCITGFLFISDMDESVVL